MHVRGGRRAVFVASPAVLAAVVLAAGAGAHSGLMLTSGVTSSPPVIDGALTPGEWAAAGQFSFPISNSAGNFEGTMYAMHDSANLYIAVQATDPSYFPCASDPFCSSRPVPERLNSFAIYFDSNHDGAVTDGEDAMIVNYFASFGDQFWDGSLPYTPSWNGDVATAGTSDGASYGTRVGDIVTYEIRHPLCSADTLHDFCLSPGDVVGFTIAFQSGDISVDYVPAYPTADASGYGDLVIGGSNFSGFFQPVDNLPVFNAVKAGSSIPVKFSLDGDRGLDVAAAGYPKSEPIDCQSTSTLDGIEETATAGSSSLSYDASTDQYTYVWKSDKRWADTCRRLIVRLKDGTSHLAMFRFDG